MTIPGQATPSVLVLGAGIAGIQAALDLADAGVSVTLAEKEDSIGGRMAQTDKTFPTLDCSSCTLTPKTADAGNHPLIRLITRCRLARASFGGGRWQVELATNPRYVDLETCVACGRCSEVCRMKDRVEKAFDLNLARGSAIGVPFPQAVPMGYAVDASKCLMVTRGKCGDKPRCVEACDVGAISFEGKPIRENLAFDAIIVATGYDLYDPAAKVNGRPELGFGRYPEVITNLQFERLSSASGPTGGKLMAGGRTPRSALFIQCVGSRDVNTGAAYCSRVCCMASLKQALLATEKVPDLAATILYMDIRAFGKGYEEFMERVQRSGVLLRRGSPSEVYRKGEGLAVRFEDTLLGKTFELETELVVLAAGLRPRPEYAALAGLLDLTLGADGFFGTPGAFDSCATASPGVFIAGTAGGPMDIPDAVASGSAAAGAALAHIIGRTRGVAV